MNKYFKQANVFEGEDAAYMHDYLLKGAVACSSNIVFEEMHRLYDEDMKVTYAKSFLVLIAISEACLSKVEEGIVDRCRASLEIGFQNDIAKSGSVESLKRKLRDIGGDIDALFEEVFGDE